MAIRPFQQKIDITITPQTSIGKIRNFFAKILGFVRTDTADYIHFTMETVWLDLVKATPWYSGAAANSWTLTVGPSEPEDKSFPSKPQNYYSYPSLPRVPVIPINKNNQMANDYYVQNGVPYIERLNAGWSPQAQPGWIEETIQNTINEKFGNKRF